MTQYFNELKEYQQILILWLGSFLAWVISGALWAAARDYIPGDLMALKLPTMIMLSLVWLGGAFSTIVLPFYILFCSVKGSTT